MTTQEKTLNEQAREVAQKAGLSPLTALGLNNAGSIANNTTPPHLQATIFDTANFQAPHFQSIANGLNLDSLTDVLIAQERLNIDKQKNLSDVEQKNLDREQRLTETSMNIQASNIRLAKPIVS